MTGDLAGAVWIGADTYKPLVTGASGGSYAAPLWAAVMQAARDYLSATRSISRSVRNLRRMWA